MSIYRNRNNRNKFYVPSATGKRREEDRTVDSGIDVKPGNGESKNRCPSGNSHNFHRRHTISTSSSGSDIEIIDEDADRKDSLDKSSASSLSWAEDYELQATDSVKDEYERMERVLQCVEPIPSHYDKDEYKLWIKTFPCISLTVQAANGLLSKADKIKSVSPEEEKVQELFEPLKKNCDKITSSVSRNSANLRNLAVIDKLLGELYPAQKHQSTHTSSTTYTNNKELAINNTINPRTLDVAFGSFLPIAPVSLPKKTNTSGRLRKNSNTKFNWRQMTPLVSTPLPNVSNENTHRERPARGNYSTQVSQTTSDFIVLPPISYPSYTSRSVSALSSSRIHQFKSNSEIIISQPLIETREFGSEAEMYPYREHRRTLKRKNRFVKLMRD